MEDPHGDILAESCSKQQQLEVPLLSADEEPTESTSSAGDDDDDDNENVEENETESSSSSFIFSDSFRGRVLLLCVSFLYGTMNVSMRLLYDLHEPPPPAILTMTRGWLVSFCFLPIIFCHRKQKGSNSSHSTSTTATQQEDTTTPTTTTTTKSIWMAAFELSVLNAFSQALFIKALQITPSARASFLGQSTVIMVPIIVSLMGETVHRKLWLGCVVSTIGLVILSQDGEEASSSIGFGLGDFLTLVATLLWSCYVIRISQIGSLYNEVELQGLKNFLAGIQYTIFVLVGWWWTMQSSSSSSNDHNDSSAEWWSGWRSPAAWAILLYSAIGPGCGADLLQQKGQELISASESNLFLAMEPLFTAILGRLILGEETGWIEKLGGGCLVLGALLGSE